MSTVKHIIEYFAENRVKRIRECNSQPKETQDRVFSSLIKNAVETEYGKKYSFSKITSYEDFKNNVPIVTYEEIFPYIKKMRNGEGDILWPGSISNFSKSSGTTNARSKFIPVSNDSLDEMHFKGGKDMLALYVAQYPESKLFDGKIFALGGSLHITENEKKEEMVTGDISAVVMKNMPWWANTKRVPDLDIALMEHWEEKIEALALGTMNEDVTCIAGVPTWTILVLKRILELTGKKHIKEVWPNLEVFFHGAVSFAPYAQIFESLAPGIRYMEIYNASEGFFALEDFNGEGMLLMLDYGIFYEFIPVCEFQKGNYETTRVHEVVKDTDYAIIISTNGGLFRYVLGDTVRFTSLSPHRIKITGRTKHFINAFGEELMVENAEVALAKTCRDLGATVANFTAGPIYISSEERGGHEWIVEFEKAPLSIEKFSELLDVYIREINSDYDAKRTGDLALVNLKISVVPSGTFYAWMKQKGKLGGQHKVPRLFNSREYIEELLAIKIG